MKDEGKALPVFLGTVSLFLVQVFLVPLRFEENDDSVMMLLASGDYSGSPSANLVFINYFLGLALRGLYAVAPGVGWYPGMMVLALSLCLALTWLTFERGEGRLAWARIVPLLALSCVLAACSLHIQFTTVSAATTTVGLWSFLRGASRTIAATGGLLVLFGFLLRFEAAALVLLVSLPFVLLFAWSGCPERRRVAALVLLLLAAFAADLAGAAAFRSVDSDYVKFNSIRGQLNDNPNAELSPERLPSGVSPNDYSLLRSFFADPAEISLDDLTAIERAVAENEQELTLKDWIIGAVRVARVREVQLALGALLLAACLQHARSGRLLVLAGCASLLLPLIYVAVMASLKDRVVLSALLAALGGLLQLEHRLPTRRFALVAQLPLVVLAALMLEEGWQRVTATVQGEHAFLGQVQMVANWPGSIVIFQNHLHVERARLFGGNLEELDGKVILAGWMVRHPDNESFRGHDMLLEEGVGLFVARGEDRVKRQIALALEENYGIRAQAETASRSQYGSIIRFRPYLESSMWPH